MSKARGAPPDLEIRAATASDWDAMATVHRDALPDQPVTGPQLRAQTEPQHREQVQHRMVAIVNHAIVGYGVMGHCRQFLQPHNLWIDGAVRPDARRRGVGRTLLTHLVRACLPLAPQLLGSTTWDDQPEAMGFLQRRGFRVRARYVESALCPARAPADRFEPPRSTLARLALELVAVDDHPDDLELRRQLHAFVVDAIADVPAPETIAPMTFERFVEQLDHGPERLPGAYFVVRSPDRRSIVGLSALRRTADPRRLQTGFTAVHRSLRRRGLARALKLHAIALAAARGIEQIRTNNAEDNVAMLALNASLGFAPHVTELEYARAVDATDLHALSRTDDR